MQRRYQPVAQEDRVQERYSAVSDEVCEDIGLAHAWAIDALMRKEGEGHQLNISARGDNQVCCSFSKPEWGGDHCGRAMDHGAEAIVMAVCEYLEGM